MKDLANLIGSILLVCDEESLEKSVRESFKESGIPIHSCDEISKVGECFNYNGMSNCLLLVSLDCIVKSMKENNEASILFFKGAKCVAIIHRALTKTKAASLLKEYDSSFEGLL